MDGCICACAHLYGLDLIRDGWICSFFCGVVEIKNKIELGKGVMVCDERSELKAR